MQCACAVNYTVSEEPVEFVTDAVSGAAPAWGPGQGCYCPLLFVLEGSTVLRSESSMADRVVFTRGPCARPQTRH